MKVACNKSEYVSWEITEDMMKLVAIDLDGTLLNHKNEIADLNKKALQQLNQKGIKVVIATGRSLISAREIFQSLDIDGYLLTLNGALIKEGKSNKTIFSKQLPKEALIKTLEIGLQEEATVFFNTEEKNYRIPYTGNGELVQEFQKMRGDVEELTFEKMREILENNNPRVLKAAFTSENRQQLRKIQGIMNQADYYPVFSDKHYIEMMDEGVNKGTSLERLCDYLEIEQKDVVAFGDQENDLQMIEFAGLGIAMENAADILKQAADEVIGTNTEAAVGRKLMTLLSTEGL
jgi:Cof subfamily protein (haloacid dehalogenase superfamily)